jgi:hypothetical protein
LFRWFNLSKGRPDESDLADAERFVMELEKSQTD